MSAIAATNAITVNDYGATINVNDVIAIFVKWWSHLHFALRLYLGRYI